MNAIRTILHPTTFSPPESAAAQLVASLASYMGAELVIMNAAPVRLLYRLPGYREALQRRLDELAALAAPVPTRTVILTGDPASAIIGFAHDVMCDMIVMGQTLPDAESLLSESIVQRVRRRVRCPVITVSVADAVPAKAGLSRIAERLARRQSRRRGRSADLPPAASQSLVENRQLERSVT